MRNIQKQAAEGAKNVPYREDLTADEIQQFMDMFKAAPSIFDGVWNVISKAFYMGYAVGQRSSKRAAGAK